MGRTLRSGERVLVEFEARDIARGDLVLYRQRTTSSCIALLGPATRRRSMPALRTRGDGSPGLDPPLEPARILGRVVALERDGRGTGSTAGRRASLRLARGAPRSGVGRPARSRSGARPPARPHGCPGLRRGARSPPRIGACSVARTASCSAGRTPVRSRRAAALAATRPADAGCYTAARRFADSREPVVAMINAILTKIVGSKNERTLKKLRPLVEQINALEPRHPARSPTTQLRGQDGRVPRAARARASRSTTCCPRRSPSCARPGGACSGMRHFDVQLIGGMVLHRGKIAEMKTGEGKTLVATLPVYLNALAGQGRARRHGQRLPGPARRGVDGPDLPLPGPERRRASSTTWTTASARRPTPRTSPTARTTSSASTTCATT